jgi:hypothetical protein
MISEVLRFIRLFKNRRWMKFKTMKAVIKDRSKGSHRIILSRMDKLPRLDGFSEYFHRITESKSLPLLFKQTPVY